MESALAGIVAALALSLPGPDQVDPQAAKAPAGSAAKPSGGYVQAHVYYTNGEYGSDEDFWRFYVPVTMGYYYDRFVASITVPWLVQEKGVTTVGGLPVPFEMETPAFGQDDDVASGIGDVLLSAGYYALQETGTSPYLLGQVELKIPTADEDEGLGTGEFDVFLRATAGKGLGKGFAFFAQLGYGFIGEPEEVEEEFRDAVFWGVGAGYEAGRNVELWMIARGNSEIVEGTDPAAEVLAQVTLKTGPRTQVFFLGGTGLTDASPDLILGVGFRQLF